LNEKVDKEIFEEPKLCEELPFGPSVVLITDKVITVMAESEKVQNLMQKMNFCIYSALAANFFSNVFLF
jgi:hypothetical protein